MEDKEIKKESTTKKEVKRRKSSTQASNERIARKERLIESYKEKIAKLEAEIEVEKNKMANKGTRKHTDTLIKELSEHPTLLAKVFADCKEVNNEEELRKHLIEAINSIKSE